MGFIMLCSCCGREITAPYFKDGLVYGYSCIKKQYPNTTKHKVKPMRVEILEVRFEENCTRGKAYLLLGDKRFIRTAYMDCEAMVFDGVHGMISGMINGSLNMEQKFCYMRGDLI